MPEWMRSALTWRPKLRNSPLRESSSSSMSSSASGSSASRGSTVIALHLIGGREWAYRGNEQRRVPAWRPCVASGDRQARRAGWAFAGIPLENARDCFRSRRTVYGPGTDLVGALYGPGTDG